MFFMIGLMFLGLIVTGILESEWFANERWMRRLIRESREYERQKMMHRNVYSEAGYFPPRQKRRLFERRG